MTTISFPSQTAAVPDTATAQDTPPPMKLSEETPKEIKEGFELVTAQLREIAGNNSFSPNIKNQATSLILKLTTAYNEFVASARPNPPPTPDERKTIIYKLELAFNQAINFANSNLPENFIQTEVLMA